MLSILIPTYNFNCVALVKSLQQQAEEEKIEYEIVVADDASSVFVAENSEINMLKNARFLPLSKNIGRANIRNLLASEAKFRYLLFIDGDAKVFTPTFLSEHIRHCAPNCCIVGGVTYEKNTNATFSLRAKYGEKCEAKKHYFSAFNLLIDRQLFLQIKFDKNLHHYGYEDFVFGIEAEKLTTIKYINNPLIHKGLDENITFLEKTEKAIRNLWMLQTNNPDIQKRSQLLRTFFLLKKWHLEKFVAKFFGKWRSIITTNLTSKNPSLFLFSCYKIGLLCSITQKSI